MQCQNVDKGYVPRKEKHRKTNKLFVCQCGSQYLGFASLYLHFQKKHNKNISSKRGCKYRRVEKVMGKTVYTYYYSKKIVRLSEHSSSSFDFESEIECVNEDHSISAFDKAKNAIGEFLKNEKLQGYKYQTVCDFLIFLEPLLSEKGQVTQKFEAWQLPYFFNPFINEKKERMNECIDQNIIKQHCQTLENLHHWLVKKGQSQLIVALKI